MRPRNCESGARKNRRRRRHRRQQEQDRNRLQVLVLVIAAVVGDAGAEQHHRQRRRQQPLPLERGQPARSRRGRENRRTAGRRENTRNSASAASARKRGQSAPTSSASRRPGSSRAHNRIASTSSEPYELVAHRPQERVPFAVAPVDEVDFEQAVAKHARQRQRKLTASCISKPRDRPRGRRRRSPPRRWMREQRSAPWRPRSGSSAACSA